MEIVGQAEAQGHRRTDGTQRIAGKIEKYLPGKCQHRQPGIRRSEGCGIGINSVHDRRQTDIGQYGLGEHAKQNKVKPQTKWSAAVCRGVLHCGRNCGALTIGPATNCGKMSRTTRSRASWFPRRFCVGKRPGCRTGFERYKTICRSAIRYLKVAAGSLFRTTPRFRQRSGSGNRHI